MCWFDWLLRSRKEKKAAPAEPCHSNVVFLAERWASASEERARGEDSSSKEALPRVEIEFFSAYCLIIWVRDVRSVAFPDLIGRLGSYEFREENIQILESVDGWIGFGFCSAEPIFSSVETGSDAERSFTLQWAGSQYFRASGKVPLGENCGPVPFRAA
jgi:hypothetical protein